MTGFLGREYAVPCNGCREKYFCLRRETGRTCARCFWQNGGCGWDSAKVDEGEVPDGKGEWRLVRKTANFPTRKSGTWGVVDGPAKEPSGPVSGKRKAEAEELEVEPGKQVKKVKGKGIEKGSERENQETALGRRENMVSKNILKCEVLLIHHLHIVIINW